MRSIKRKANVNKFGVGGDTKFTSQVIIVVWTVRIIRILNSLA